jgi:hypothetical protein
MSRAIFTTDGSYQGILTHSTCQVKQALFSILREFDMVNLAFLWQLRVMRPVRRTADNTHSRGERCEQPRGGGREWADEQGTARVPSLSGRPSVSGPARR